MAAEFKERISKPLMARMLFVAGFFDTLNFIFEFVDAGAISGPIISTVNWGTFTWWLWTRDVKFTKSPKIGKTMLIGLIWGFIPVLNALPEYTGTILRICIVARSEDQAKKRALEEQKKQQMVMEEHQRRAKIIALRNSGAEAEEEHEEAA
jgi:hypothetical protein